MYAAGTDTVRMRYLLWPSGIYINTIPDCFCDRLVYPWSAR